MYERDRVFSSIILLFLLIFFSPKYCSADIEGYVKDIYGKPVAGATVCFINEAAPKINFTAITDEFGKYVINLSSTIDLPIRDAASYGLISQYCYLFDGTQYVPVSVFNNTEIAPWMGFWVILNRNLDLLFPKSTEAGQAPENASFEAAPNRWYLLSAPLKPANGDILAVFGEALKTYGDLWRVYRWKYDEEKYYHYGETLAGGFDTVVPGRGFFLKQKYVENKSIIIQGIETDIDKTYCAIPLKASGDKATFHMVGNPFWYNINWNECTVRVSAEEAGFLGKVAVTNSKTPETVQIGLQLQSADGKYLDTYNRAGVVLSGNYPPEYFLAPDIAPMEPYVRLMIRDPLKPQALPMAYDYRALNQPEYTWEIELQTTLDQVQATLSLVGIQEMTALYNLNIYDPETGETKVITQNISLNATLFAKATKRLILSATAKPLSTDAAKLPEPFGIKNINPNPFNPQTQITFSLERDGLVNLSVYNIQGQLVQSLVESHMSRGTHNIAWNASRHGSGVYMVVLKSNGFQDSKRITFMK